jgi:hypothetical protein
MLMTNHLSGFSAGNLTVEFSFLQTATSLVDNATYSFASQSFGADDPARRIVCVITVDSVTLGNTIVNTCTIGGVSAAKLVEATNANGALTSIWQSLVPLGATGTVSFTLSQTMQNASISLYRCTNIDGAGFATASDGTGDPSSVTVDCPANGIVIAGNVIDGTTGSATWTGLTETFDATVETSVHTSAANFFAAAQTNLAVTCDHSGAGTIHTLCVAAFAPAPGAA